MGEEFPRTVFSPIDLNNFFKKSEVREQKCVVNVLFVVIATSLERWRNNFGKTGYYFIVFGSG